VILPVNSTVDGGAMVFRTDPGSKLDAAAAGATVAFEVDAADERDRTGWSVMVRGQAAEVSELADLERRRRWAGLARASGASPPVDWKPDGSSCGCLGGRRPRDGRP
jgi:nitroimidazol reductase NimA-like FMN-containing flavoprotein (pyridoxamine 5'-phosphate oxidase superfamily)